MGQWPEWMGARVEATAHASDGTVRIRIQDETYPIGAAEARALIAEIQKALSEMSGRPDSHGEHREEPD